MNYKNKVCIKGNVPVPVSIWDGYRQLTQIGLFWMLTCPHCRAVSVDPHWECVFRFADFHASGVCNEISKIGV